MLIRAFAAMCLGGFGSLPGAVVGGITLGILENIIGGYVSSSLVDITAYLVIVIVLVIGRRASSVNGGRGVPEMATAHADHRWPGAGAGQSNIDSIASGFSHWSCSVIALLAFRSASTTTRSSWSTR